MGNGFKIGRILGINIRVDWSWLLIFVLVTWNLGSVFGQLHEDWSLALRWGIALIAAILFFSSVLAHELAHSLVARRQGTPVRNITLFLFGGVSNIQREPDSPGREFVMAVVGPLTSIVLGGILALLASIGGGTMSETITDPAELVSRLSPVTFLLTWLGSVNVAVGLFNLIPGFPLDGGRILRSIFWAATGNLRRATRWASWAGQGIAWLMILGGIATVFGVSLPFFGSGLTNGLWLAFIGWFLHSASSRGYRQVVIRDVLDDVPVRRMMRTDPPQVSPEITISTLVHERIMQSDDHAFPVMEGQELVGIVTLEDVRSVPRRAWESKLVREAMTPAAELTTVGPEENAADALLELARSDFRQLPVLEEGRLVGLLRRRDITRWLQLQDEGVLS